MADLVVTAAQVARIFPNRDEVHSGKATEAITAGQAVYRLSTGLVGVADANAAGKQQIRGVALQTVAAGQFVDFMKEGWLAGFTISQNPDTQIFLSDTAGALADAAGTMSVPCGRVVNMTDGDLTKVLYINCDWITQWA